MLLPMMRICGCNSALRNLTVANPNAYNLVISVEVTGLLSFYMDASSLQFLLNASSDNQTTGLFYSQSLHWLMHR